MLLMTICEIVYAFGTLFVACELCDRLAIAFEETGEMFEQLDWYLFPIEIQRIMQMSLIFTQQPFAVYCFGSITCDRETFKSVRANLDIQSWSTN